jgi:LPXTG-motif cell wall-anchored protein
MQLTGNHYLIKTANSSESGSRVGSAGGAGSEGSLGTPSPSNSSGSSTSKAWIAGAVIGPIVGVALVGLAVWFFRRKRASQLPLSQPQEMPTEGHRKDHVAEKAVPSPNTYHELGGTKPLGQSGLIHQELPANNGIVHELPANIK